MPFGLPSIGESQWGQKILDSINAVKGTADGAETAAAAAQATANTASATANAALPSASLDAEVAADINTPGSATETALSASFGQGNLSIIHVHPTGNDANAGTTPGRPKRTIQAALDALGVNRGTVQLGAATYPITAPIHIDTALHAIRGVLGTIIDASSMTTGTAIEASGSIHPPHYSAFPCFDTFELVGPGSTSTVDGISYETAGLAGGNVHIGPRNINTHGFRYGEIIGDEAFCITHFNCTWWSNDVAIHLPAGVNNSGERITYVGCTIYNNGTSGLHAYSSNADVMFTACSFDYNGDGRQIDVNDARVFLTDCHVEGYTDAPNIDFTVTGNIGLLSMKGGELIHNGAGPAVKSYVVQADGNADGCGATFDGVFMNQLLTTTGYFANGTGFVELRNTQVHPGNAAIGKAVSAATNLLSDGTMEDAAVLDPWWHISQDTAAITTALTGANIGLAKSTSYAASGTRSLAATKAGAAGSAAAFCLTVPIVHTQRPLWRLKWRKPGAALGDIYLSAYAALCDTSGAVPVMKKVKVLRQIGVTLTAADTGWTPFEVEAFHGRLPAWATHFVFEVNLSSMGAGAVYVDEAEITSI